MCRSPSARHKKTTRGWFFRKTLQAELLGSRQVFFDTGFFAFQIAQVIQLGLTHVAATLDLDRINDLAMGLEHAFYAETVRNLAHRESGIDAGILDGDNDAFIGLDAFAIAFLNLYVNDDGVAWTEFRQLALHLFGFKLLEKLVHGCTKLSSFR